MKVSVIVENFVDQASVEAWVQAESFVANGAWAKVEISPMFVAVNEAKITPAWLKSIGSGSAHAKAGGAG